MTRETLTLKCPKGAEDAVETSMPALMFDLENLGTDALCITGLVVALAGHGGTELDGCSDVQGALFARRDDGPCEGHELKAGSWQEVWSGRLQGGPREPVAVCLSEKDRVRLAPAASKGFLMVTTGGQGSVFLSASNATGMLEDCAEAEGRLRVRPWYCLLGPEGYAGALNLTDPFAGGMLLRTLRVPAGAISFVVEGPDSCEESPDGLAEMPEVFGGPRMRVSIKNTFLDVDMYEEAAPGSPGWASPGEKAVPAGSRRSKSAETSPSSSPVRRPEPLTDVQIQRLNELLESLPRVGSGASSPNFRGLPSPVPGGGSGAASPPPLHLGSGAASPDNREASPAPGPRGRNDCGPSQQELRELKMRLEEMCHLQRRSRSPTMSDDGRDGAGGLRQVWSSSSLSTMASQPGAGEEEGDVEFDLAIEEDARPKEVVQALEQPVGHQKLKARSRTNTHTSGMGSPGIGSPGGPSRKSSGWMSPERRESGYMSPTERRDSGRHSGCDSGRMSPCSGSARPGQMSPGGSRVVPKEYRHGHVPRYLNLAAEAAKSGADKRVTTLMIRNIPNLYTQRELIVELESLGFGSGTFDFLYLPLDNGTKSNVGYAFVNFVNENWAQRCMAAFQNHRFRKHRKVSGKIASVSVAHIQGLEENLRHYEKAAVNTAKDRQRRPVVMANMSQALGELLPSQE